MSSKSDIFASMQTETGSRTRAIEAVNPELLPSPAFASKHLDSFKKVLMARRSIRVYDGERIPEASMREILQEATLAPSSSNLQTYELYWVRDAEKKKALGAACLGQPAATTAGELIVVVARADLWQQNLQKLLTVMKADGRKLSPSVEFYYGTLIPKIMTRGPLGIFDFLRRVNFSLVGRKRATTRTPVSYGDHRVFGHTQAALAAQTLMLSLTAHGYDSCPMGGFDSVRVKNILGLAPKAEVVMVVSAGTRKPEGLYGPQMRLAPQDLIKEI